MPQGIQFFRDFAAQHGKKVDIDPQSKTPVARPRGLGNAVQSWLGGVSPTDAKNNRDAIDCFNNALSEAYGESVAPNSWDDTLRLLHAKGQPLTPGVVRRVLEKTDQRAAKMHAYNRNRIGLFATGAGGASTDIGWTKGYYDLVAARAKRVEIPENLTDKLTFSQDLEKHLEQVTKGVAGKRLLTTEELESHAGNWTAGKIADGYATSSAAAFSALTPKLKASLDPLGQETFRTMESEIESAIRQASRQQGRALDQDTICSIATATMKKLNETSVRGFLEGYKTPDAPSAKRRPFLDLLDGDVDPGDPIYGKLAMPDARYAYPRLSLAERETARSLIKDAVMAKGQEQDTPLTAKDVLDTAKDVLAKLIGARATLAGAVPVLAQRFPADGRGETQNTELFDRVRATLAESVFGQVLGQDKFSESRFVSYLARGTDVIAEDPAREGNVKTTYQARLAEILGADDWNSLGDREKARVVEWAAVMEATRWVEQRTLGRLSLGEAEAANMEDGQKHLLALRALAQNPSASGIDWSGNEVLQAVQEQIAEMVKDPARAGAPIDLAAIGPATIAIRYPASKAVPRTTMAPTRSILKNAAPSTAAAPTGGTGRMTEEEPEIEIEKRQQLAERRKMLPDYPSLAEHDFGQLGIVVPPRDMDPNQMKGFTQDVARQREREQLEAVGREAFEALHDRLQARPGAGLTWDDIQILVKAPEQLKDLGANADSGSIKAAHATVTNLQDLNSRLAGEVTAGSIGNGPLASSLMKDVSTLVVEFDKSIDGAERRKSQAKPVRFDI